MGRDQVHPDRATPGRWPAPGHVLFVLRYLAIVYVVMLACLVWWSDAPIAMGWRPSVVLTGSMRPTIPPGDIALIGPANPGAGLPPGRVILVRDSRLSSGTYLHRIVRYDAAHRIITKGDANRDQDSTPVEANRVAGQVLLVVPLVGQPIVWLHDHRFAPAVGFALTTWAALWLVARRRHRSPPGRPRHRRRTGRGTRYRAPHAGLTLTAVVVTILSLWNGTAAVWSGTTNNSADSFVAGTWPTTGGLQWSGSAGYAQSSGTDVTADWTMTRESTNATTWSQVANGRNHTCAVRTDGTLWCWGRNAYGQLGVGSTTDQKNPTQVGTGTTWSQIAAGGQHTCAIKTDHTLWCWGYNGEGQVGNGGTTNQTSPVQIAGGSTTWMAVTAGSRHTCALVYSAGSSIGATYCWGNDQRAQGGDGGSSTPHLTPTVMGNGGGTTFSAISAGDIHTCGIKGTGTNGALPGTLWCAGEGAFGQNANSNWQWSKTAAQVGSASDWSAVSAGNTHTCALKSNGTIWCMGLNDYGQLGQNDTTSRNAMTQVGTNTWSALEAGGDTTCATAGGTTPAGAAGTAWCWGSNAYGKYGNGDTALHLVPYQAATGTWSVLSVGERDTCMISSGSLSCAGGDEYGELGRGVAAVDMATSQTAVQSTIRWSSVATGTTSTCGIDSATQLWCWGANTYGQLGIGSTTAGYLPSQVGSATWAAVTVGGSHACGLQTDNTLWCWGANTRGQLGQGNTTQQNSPVQVAVPAGQGGGTTWQRVATGRNHTCAVLSNGTLWCWGANGSGQLGIGNTTDQTSPTQVSSGITTWSRLSAGAKNTCATRGSPGTLWCWGDDLRGQIDGSSNGGNQTTPAQIGGATTWTSVTLGEYHGCGLQGSTLSCWGDNSRGQLGTGATPGPTSAAAVSVSGVTWSSVAAGDWHTCAETVTRALYCWGANTNGQLGQGSSIEQMPGTASPPGLVASPPAVVGYAVGGNTTFALIGSYAGAVLAVSPSGYWRLGESSGTTATAYAGGQNGTYTNSPTLGVAGNLSNDPDTAVTFNGTGNVVTFGDVHDYAGTSPFTVDFWMNRSGTTPASRVWMCGKERYVSDTNRGGWAVMIAGSADASPNNIMVGRYDGTSGATEITSKTQTVAGTWYHVVATYDGTTMSLYVNGVLEASAASSLSVENNTTSMSVGGLPSSNYFTGTLDEVAVYDKVLSATTISGQYAAR